MLIGISNNKKIKLKNTKINMNGKDTTYTMSDDENDFTHYLYMFPNEHSGFRIIHKDNVKKVRKADDKDYAELANELFEELLPMLCPPEETKGYKKAYKELIKQFEAIPDSEKSQIVELYNLNGIVDFTEYPKYKLTFEMVRELDAGKDYYINIGDSSEIFVLRKNEIDDEKYSVDILEWEENDANFRITYAKNLDSSFIFDNLNIKQITDFEMKSFNEEYDEEDEDE